MLVSIIIPIYNGRKYIKETLESCFNQTVSEKEIIIIDDCSTEPADDILEEYYKYNNFHYLKNESNQGMIRNNNKGASLAKGEYLIFLGQDDLLPPDHLEKMIKRFDESTSFVYCDHDEINSNSEITRTGFMPDEVNFYILSMYCISSCGIVILREKFDEISGIREIPNCPMYGEWALWIDLLSVGKAKKCCESKSMYRRHETNITNTFGDKSKNPLLYKYHRYCRKLAHKKGKFTLIQQLHYIHNYIKCAIGYYLK